MKVATKSESQSSERAVGQIRRFLCFIRQQIPTQLRLPDEESKALFLAEERRLNIRSVALLCILAGVLVVATSLVDTIAYPQFVGAFFKLRLLCAAVLLCVLWSLSTNFAQKHYRGYTLVVPLIPAFFIACMIYLARDPGSPYYSALTLCLVATGFIFHWTMVEGIIATGITLALYSLATYPWVMADPALDSSVTVGNLLFISLNGIVIVVGSYFQHRARLREFLTRLEFDRSRIELKRSNQQLRELDSLKNDFLANVSHELRTPLTLMLAPIESMRRQRDMAPAEAGLVQTMHEQALRLLKLINDLLDIAKLESGQLQLRCEKVKLRPFTNGMIDSIGVIASQRNLTVTAHVSDEVVTVETDREKLEKICLNLLFNAIKFTPEYGRVHLGVRSCGEKLVFTIKDSGIGIPPDRLPFIFERFWQEDSSTRRKHPGTGIGLALVKELAEAMGGNVTAESTLGQGTVVTVNLPVHLSVEKGVSVSAPEPASDSRATDDWLAKIHRQAEFSPALGAGVDLLNHSASTEDLISVSAALPLVPGEAGSILIADDDVGIRAYLAGELVGEHEVIEAINGLDAVEQAKKQIPDVILLDYMMPEMDGMEVCRALRKDSETRMIPIMLLTARADEGTRLAGLEAGANDVLIKPFSLVEFHTRVRNLLEGRRLQKELEYEKDLVEDALVQLRETESQLVQSEKLAAVGQLSAAILHEINNPLNYSTSALFALTKKLQRNGILDHEELIEDLNDGLKRISSTISDLRDFTHPDTGKLVDVQLTEALSVARRLVAQRFRDEEVELIDDQAEDYLLLANQNLLIQVFINIFQNACDALDGQESKCIEVFTEMDSESGTVSIAIRDNGPGIRVEDIPQLFDPFFTTKEVGKGTGLGLSICRRLIEEHGGQITVQTELGTHTTFRIMLPLQDHAETSQPLLAAVS